MAKHCNACDTRHHDIEECPTNETTDTERLDWIFNHLALAEQVITNYRCDTYGDPEPKPTVRDAIDAAMKAQK